MTQPHPQADSIRLSHRPSAAFWEIPVLYEDDLLLALDKPARLLTSPDRHDPDPERPNLMRLLHEGIRLGAPWAVSRHLSYLANVHRLDPETTGVLLLAKSKPALVFLADQFGTEKPLRQYLALVHGSPEEDRFDVSAKLAPDPARPGLTRVSAKAGKRALTTFTVLERFRTWTLLRCEPVTDRLHQVRIHLRYRRLPIAGDAAYGSRPLLLSQLKTGYRFKKDRPELPLIGRVALHAAMLRLRHPAREEWIEIEAPCPKDMAVALKQLRRYASLGPPAVPTTPNTPGANEQEPAQE